MSYITLLYLFLYRMMKISIIIADGSDIVRSGLQHILRQSKSIEIKAVASDNSELQKFVTEHKPNIVLVDYTSKGFDANSISIIKKNSSETKIIGITHSPTILEVNSALKKGVISHIKKDCPTQEIIESVLETANNIHFFCGEVLEVLKENNKDKGNLNCSPISLSDREMEIVKLISEGYTNSQIAVVLHISNHTVNTHRKNIMRKLGVGNTAGIVIFAVKTNLVSPDKFEFSPTDK